MPHPTSQNINSYHYPTSLKLDPNNLVKMYYTPTPKFSYPIPQENLQNLIIISKKPLPSSYKHYLTHSNSIPHTSQLEDAQERFQEIITILSSCIKKCKHSNSPSYHTMPTNKSNFYPTKQQKWWNQLLKIYHGIHNAIQTTFTQPYHTWQNHRDIRQLYTLLKLTIPSLSNTCSTSQAWIKLKQSPS